MIEVQGHDSRKPENLKENMNPHWYETEKQKCAINDGSS
jgi:hypothetical protein